MAKDIKVNRMQEPVAAPDYTNATSMPIPDVSLGTLFEGVGNAAQGIVAGADMAIKRSIRQDVLEGMDTLRTDYGVDSATALQTNEGIPTGDRGPQEVDVTKLSQTPPRDRTGDEGLIPRQSGGDVPPGMRRQATELRKITTAYANGTIPESHYWARANNIVAQLRARYPGYRDFIDGIVRSELGVNPANALQRNLWSEASSSQASEQKMITDRINFLQQYQQYIPARYREQGLENLARSGEYNKIENIIGKRRFNQQKLDERNRSIDMEGKLDERKKRRVYNTAVADINNTVSTALSDIQGTLHPQFGSLKQLLQAQREAMAAGRPISGEDLNKARAGLGELKQQLQTVIDTRLRKPQEALKGRSYADVIGEDRVKEITNLAMGTYTVLEESFLNDDLGSLSFAETMLENATNEKMQQIMNQSEVAPMLKAISDLYGPNALNFIYLKNPELFDKWTSDLSDLAMTQSLANNGQAGTPSSGVKSVSDVADLAAKDDEVDPRIVPDFINRNQNVINNPTAPQEMKVAALRTLYGPDNLRIWDSSQPGSIALKDREKMFNLLVNDQMTAKVLQIAANGNPEIFNLYSDFAFNRFQALNMTDLETIQDIKSRREFIDLGYDFENQQFYIYDRRDPAKMTWAVRGVEHYLEKDARAAVARINGKLKKMKVLLDSSGIDSKEATPRLMAALAVDVNANFEGSAARMGTEWVQELVKGDAPKDTPIDNPKGVSPPVSGQDGSKLTPKEEQSLVDEYINEGFRLWDKVLGVSEEFIDKKVVGRFKRDAQIYKDTGADIAEAVGEGVDTIKKKGDELFNKATGATPAENTYDPNAISPPLSGSTPGDVMERYLGKMVQVESSGNPNAKASTSSALGLAQFTEGTWMEMVKKYTPSLMGKYSMTEILDMRRDPKLTMFMAQKFTEENIQHLEKNNVPITEGSLYLAHFLGKGGAVRMLKAPLDDPAYKHATKGQVKANHSIFYYDKGRPKTVGTFLRWAETKMGNAAGASAIPTASGSVASTFGDSPITGSAQPLEFPTKEEFRSMAPEMQQQVMEMFLEYVAQSQRPTEIKETTY